MNRVVTFLLHASLVVPSLAVRLPKPGVGATYDYVVIGGGTSGLAIAARLAEDPDVSVAVVEAGGLYQIESGPPSVIPGLAGTANTGTDPSDFSPVDWNFITQPMTGADNRVIRYARGRTLGGSSARHYMVYQRGTKGTYEGWAETTGDDSWTWDSVLPYFKKTCTLTPPNMSTRSANSSVTYNPDAFDEAGAPLHVSWANYADPFSTYVEIGLESIGVLPDTDFNSGSLNGSSWSPVTIDPRDVTRSSSQTSFLPQPIQDSPLNVYQHTMALKINFRGKTATGVLVEHAGVQFTLRARREVILSAGAFQSPQLLMVSGIGPREVLRAQGIKTIVDLPGVGQNLWDHLMFGVVNEVNVITSSRMVFDPTAMADAVAQYANQRGPLTSPGFGVLGWGNVPEDMLSQSTKEALAAFPSDWPVLEYLSVDGILNGWRSNADQLAGGGRQMASIAAALVAPLSRGSITISSPDAHVPPVIDLGFLTHPADQEVAIAAFKLLRQAWIGAGIAIGDEFLPGSDVQTDEEILAHLRGVISPVFHAAGTCAMGKPTDPNAVVDTNARVIGVNNLRVVDASIFPTLPPGHPQSSCYMVAEKIADVIKNGH